MEVTLPINQYLIVVAPWDCVLYIMVTFAGMFMNAPIFKFPFTSLTIDNVCALQTELEAREDDTCAYEPLPQLHPVRQGTIVLSSSKLHYIAIETQP